jgi:hypothetical protein
MVKDLLVSNVVRGGEELLRALDKAEFPVDAAFWLLDVETERWKYFIASPVVDKEGPLHVYRELQKYIGASSELALQDIAVVSPRDRTVELLRKGACT